jgi:hypothetical protein
MRRCAPTQAEHAGTDFSIHMSNSQLAPLSSPGSTGRPSIPETPAIEPRSRGVLGPPLSRGMTTEQASTISRRHAPEVCQETLAPSKLRGRRECRMHDAPAASRAKKKQRTRAYKVHRNKRHSLRNGFTVAPCSPWCTGLVSHHRLRELPPANLTPASGCQDHTAWPSARALPVSQHSRGHRHLSHVCDVGQRPSHRDRMALRKQVIWGARKQKYFFQEGLTGRSKFLFFGRSDLPVGQSRSRRASQILGQRAVGQSFGQMQPADFFRAVEIGQRAGDAQHAMIAARRQPHGLGGVTQQLCAL